MKTVKISVIIPVFNVQCYLCDCVESILRQTYGNYEIVLVDDGSTDESGNICDQYQEQYPEIIKAIHTHNGGPLRARIEGMKYVSGDVLVFLDGDDCFRKDAFRSIVSCFIEKACDMVLFDAEPCQDFSSFNVKHPFDEARLFNENSKEELYKKMIQGVIPNSVCLKAVRTECVSFPEHLMRCSARHGEDLLLSAHFVTDCQTIAYINEGLYHYRNRPVSAVHSFNSERKESIKTVHTELEKYIDEWGMQVLKPLHNARKVKGWIDNFRLLVSNRENNTKKEFRKEVAAMSNDSYFRTAYKNMDRSYLSRKYRLFSWLLYYGPAWLGCARGSLNIFKYGKK